MKEGKRKVSSDGLTVVNKGKERRAIVIGSGIGNGVDR